MIKAWSSTLGLSIEVILGKDFTNSLDKPKFREALILIILRS
jgi:hypothetical protein